MNQSSIEERTTQPETSPLSSQSPRIIADKEDPEHGIQQQEIPIQAANPSTSDLFSFNIDEFVDDEDTGTSHSMQNHPDIKDQLSAILQLFRQNTSVLLENTEPIQRLFRQIMTHLTDKMITLLTPAAFIESHYYEVQGARKRIADRQANYAQSLKALETERDQLMLELDRVNKAVAKAQGRLNDYPITIQEKKKELADSINQVCRQHRQVKDIPSFDEEDL
uniref:DUF1409 domain-containing protein n=1 Tax=Setaria italica TaxID=4555 RepID=K4ALP9_SETIT